MRLTVPTLNCPHHRLAAFVKADRDLRPAPPDKHSTSTAVPVYARPDYAATNNIPSSPHHSASQNPHVPDASHVPNCCSKPLRHDSKYDSRRNQRRSNAPLPRTHQSPPPHPNPVPKSSPQDSQINFASAVPPATNNPAAAPPSVPSQSPIPAPEILYAPINLPPTKPPRRKLPPTPRLALLDAFARMFPVVGV
jgi:hypothetical protein